MVGDHPSLGNWDVAKGIELETQQEPSAVFGEGARKSSGGGP